jgi:hypothetical protein
MEAVVEKVRKYNMRFVYVMERPTVRLSLGGYSALWMLHPHLPPPPALQQKPNPLPVLTKTHIPPSEEEQPRTSQLNLPRLHRRLDKDAAFQQENGLWHGGVSGVVFEFFECG